MQIFVLLWFSFCLLCSLGITVKDVATAVMKAVIVVAVCCLIGFVWIN